MSRSHIVRIGIIGAAHHHIDGYLPLLQSFTHVELIGITDSDRSRAAAYSERYGIAHHASLRQLLAQRPDAVIVCSTNSEHADHAVAAAEAGAHILCEKPLATTVADALRMTAACAAAAVTLMPALPMRFSEPVRAGRRIIGDGGIGAIRGGSSANQGQMPHAHRMWFIDPVAAGGGAIMDHTIHVVDLLRWFTGSEVTRLCCFSNSIIQPAPTTLETGALLMVHFEGDISFSIDASWSRPQRYPTWGGLTMRVVGSDGILEIDPFSQYSALYGDSDQHTRYDFWGKNPDQAMLLDFVDAVAANSTPQVTAADGVAAQRVIDAAYRSAQTGVAVDIIR